MYYLVKAKYERMGETKPVTEQYLFQTEMFSSAEFAALKILGQYATDGVDIVSITRFPVSEVIGDTYGIESQMQHDVAEMMGKHPVSDDADKWFKVKAAFITIDEKTLKEKRQSFNIMVNANTVDGAHNLADNHLRHGMADYVIESVTETKIMDVYVIEHNTPNE